MWRVASLVLTIFITKISCDCIRYTFGNDFEDVFIHETNICSAMERWDLGYYNNTELTSYNDMSVSFISPRATFSCVSSFIFPMEAGGIVEVVVFMAPTDASDQIYVIAYQYVGNGNDVVQGTASYMAIDPNFETGWQTLRIKLIGNGVHDGYLIIMGMAASNSIVLVDSFRYIPPYMDESLCRLYENDEPPPPVTTIQPPMTVTEQPVTTTPPPVTVTEQPMPTTEAPVTSSQPPITTREPSMTTTEPPEATTILDTTTELPPATTQQDPTHACMKYTFQDNFELFTNKLGHCYGMGLWDIQYYNTTDLTGQNQKSVSFISPRERLSCVSSFIFRMRAGGIIEVNQFMKSANQFDQIAILASQYVSGGNDIVVGSINNLAMSSTFVSGWHTLRFSIFGSGFYDGYISIMGLASPRSTVLVDSFRYVPPYMDESLCQLYEDDISTTDLPETPTDITDEPLVTSPETTTNLPETTTQPEYTCVRYTFEDNFNELFTNKLGYCYGMGSWDVHFYNTTNFIHQNDRSVSFISPRERLSCVSSFMFPMTAGGMIEVNIFMETANQFDQIAILASQYVPNGNDVVVGSINSLAMSSDYVDGWDTLRFTVFGSGTYVGYLSIMGLATPRSTVLVDSFRYIPPHMEESMCRLYEDDLSTTVPPEPPLTTPKSPVTTTQPPVTITQPPASITETTTQRPNTTLPPATTTESTTQTLVTTTLPTLVTTQPVTVPDTTTKPEHTCVRYAFENKFEELFTNELGPCGWMMEFWDLRHYNTTDITSQTESSVSFISPRQTLSCVSSFVFPMTSGGLIEVNTYMESDDPLDQITILANRYMVDGNDAVTGHSYSSPFNADFVSGWRTLRFHVTGLGIHDGYITLMGMASPNSVVLVDSFRYIPPNMDESLCQLYEDDTIAM